MIYSGTSPSTADLTVSCEGEIASATGLVVDISADPSTILIYGNSGSTVSYTDGPETWTGDPNQISMKLSIDESTMLIRNEEHQEFLIPVIDIDTIAAHHQLKKF